MPQKKRHRMAFAVISAAILVVAGLYIVDQLLRLSYNGKILVKLVLFAVFPLLYICLTGDNFIRTSFHNRAPALRLDWTKALGLGVIVIIVAAFWVTKGKMDVTAITGDFTNKYKIGQNQLVWYGAYLTFGNSLLEEFFFRGFVFLGLRHLGFRWLGYGVSSLLFALYHIANFQTWFHPLLFVLALAGLLIGGLIFCALDDRADTFFNSWFVHICADLAIVALGLTILL